MLTLARRKFRSSLVTRCVIALTLLTSVRFSSAHGEEVDFNRDVRPVLSDSCFLCHGPDPETREAGLRLDDRGSAIEFGAIVPGDSQASEIIARITSDDPDLVMPPPDSGKPLTQANVEAIRNWVAAGASYDEHWAFVAPQRPAIPEVENSDRCNNPIDYFVAAKLGEKQLEPSPAADRPTLVRRMYLDLIGLPPSPDELDRWLAASGDAWTQQLVEELMQSPHFGERWARWWLDAARYSDSDGYEKDKPREVWFYRDWVIHAMNKDLPYDEFVIRQIAGDLLPRATQADRVATGFLRNSMVNEEGGADPEQFRVEGMFDRLDAIGKSILGITTQCAQCHTHKYDPLTQDDFYRMFAALNNFHEAIITVYSPQEERARIRLLGEIASIEEGLRNATPTWEEDLRKWHAKLAKDRPTWTTLTPNELPYEGQKFRPLEDGSIISESYAPTRNDISFPCTLPPGTYTAARLDLLMHPQLPHGGPGRSIFGTGALTEFDVSIPDSEKPGQKKVVKLRRAVADVNPAKTTLPNIFRDRDPTKDERVTGGIEMAIDGDRKTAWSTDNGPGRRNQDRHAVFEFETPLIIEEPTTIWFHLVQSHGGWNSDDNQNYLMGRYRFSVTGHARPIDLDAPSSVEAALAKSFESLSDSERNELFAVWRQTQESWGEFNQRIEKLWDEHPEGTGQLAVIERERPRETYVMIRGDFLSPGNAVQPGMPDFLNPTEPTDEPARLRLARWLVDEDAPTTARVIVNRLWQSYFGRGIVTTPEDFGRQSPAPTHPELLDWLAVELMENDWSLKHIHRLIVGSATYQQSSKVSPDQLAVDRYNEWLARGPRHRLDAELIRDTALRISGLLNDEIGGPSVYPPAPAFLFQPPASYGPKIWEVNTDDDQYRRSLYVHSYRSVPYPPLQVFDAPKGDAACIRRERSNTPLQALVVLNEPQFVDCARAFAMRILRESPNDDQARIEHAYRLATGRMPDDTERKILVALLQQQRDRVQGGELHVSELLGVEPMVAKQLTGYSAEEILPWLVVARTLLNLDETITKG